MIAIGIYIYLYHIYIFFVNIYLSLYLSLYLSIGDLSFRFPNSLEPWTISMYARLSDTNTAVRYNTLMVAIYVSMFINLSLYICY
jgi:hypothetical protein